MKGFCRDLILTGVLAFAIPALLLCAPKKTDNEDVPAETTIETVSEEPTPVTVTLLQTDGSVIEVELQEYVLCAVLKEMPASFESEALKAQSVVARTYAMKRKAGNPKHPEADLCTNSQCCQGYCTAEDYLQQGGNRVDVEKIQKAVNDTQNEVLTYQNELIDATYFSCSGGVTEDAKAVWGQDVPYLQSVQSPGEEFATHFTDTVTISLGDFQYLLGLKLRGDPDGWIEDICYTDSGGVDTITLGGAEYTGVEFRKKLGLRSTYIDIGITENAVVITTRGYGHRVGMSQYGADAMALAGKNYTEILKHYYTGVEITTYSHND